MTHDVHYLKDEIDRLIGSAFEDYDDRGFGRAEEVDQEWLERIPERRAITFRAKHELACYDQGCELKRRHVPDLFAPGKHCRQTKVCLPLASKARGQILNYLRITKQPPGYRIHFGKSDGLDFKSIILSELLPE